MAVLQSTNVQGALCVNGVAVGGGKDFKYCCFTASSTFTPTQDLVDGDGAVDTTLVGGGGGAGFTSVGQIQCNPPTTVYSWCKIACASMGGGAGTGTYIQDITATDACSVTVGAGGVATPSTEVCFCNCAGWDPSVLTSEPGTGGDSSFGDHTESGGGGGCSRRCFCIGGGYGEVGYNTAATFNGASSYSNFGGGAQAMDLAGGYNWDQNSPTGKCQMYTNLPYLDRNQNWGATSNTASYHFYPAIENCKASRVECECSFATFRNGTYINQPFAQNNGVRLNGGQVIGTNKLSLFEDGNYESSCCASCVAAGNYGSCVCVFGYTSSVADAINCGGGAGRERLVVCVGNVCGAWEVQQQNSKGGDGLVILKWFE